MTKTQVLQEIFKWGGKTIWHLNQIDVANDLWIDLWNMNKYVLWKIEPRDRRYRDIIESAKKIAKSKYDFILQVEDY